MRPAKFEEFGLSNFPAWQVVEICPLCGSVVAAFEKANDLVEMKSEYYLQYPYPKEGSPWRLRTAP